MYPILFNSILTNLLLKVKIDGKPYVASDHVMYNTVMISDVPNFGFVVGYTNASWTLKADIASLYFTKLLNYMKDNGIARVIPKDTNLDMKYTQWDGGLTSGYISRATKDFPFQGDVDPWAGGRNYLVDLFNLYVKKLSIDSLEFTPADKKSQ